MGPDNSISYLYLERNYELILLENHLRDCDSHWLVIMPQSLKFLEKARAYTAETFTLLLNKIISLIYIVKHNLSQSLRDPL